MATEIIPKRCSECKKFKPLSEFSKSQSKKDGLQGCCKSCKKAYQKTYQQSERGKAAKRKALVKYYKTPEGKAAHRKAAAKRNARNPNKIKAKNAVNIAIRAGKLQPASSMQCHYCSEPAEEYHHYLGYEPEHWLDVIPLCLECHKKVHRKIA